VRFQSKGPSNTDPQNQVIQPEPELLTRHLPREPPGGLQHRWFLEFRPLWIGFDQGKICTTATARFFK